MGTNHTNHNVIPITVVPNDSMTFEIKSFGSNYSGKKLSAKDLDKFYDKSKHSFSLELFKAKLKSKNTSMFSKTVALAELQATIEEANNFLKNDQLILEAFKDISQKVEKAL